MMTNAISVRTGTFFSAALLLTAVLSICPSVRSSVCHTCEPRLNGSNFTHDTATFLVC